MLDDAMATVYDMQCVHVYVFMSDFTLLYSVTVCCSPVDLWLSIA